MGRKSQPKNQTQGWGAEACLVKESSHLSIFCAKKHQCLKRFLAISSSEKEATEP